MRTPVDEILPGGSPSASRRLVVSAALFFVGAVGGMIGCKQDATRPSPTTTTTASGAARPGSSDSPALAVGQPAPDFTATDHNGNSLTLSALKGRPVVVYFYPKDETSGCTKEASSFRDAWKDFGKAGVVVIGVSTESLDSHRSFAKNHDLPFHLVSDSSGSIAKSFGVPNRAGFLSRQTFVIDASGNVKRIYRDVDVTKHATEVLTDLQAS